MRKLFPLLAVCATFSCLTLAIAAEEKTVTGDAVCAKCALKEAPKCQNVVLVKEGDETVNYYLTGPVSQKAHGALGICTASKEDPVKVKVTGEVSEKDGKKSIEVSKIDKAD